jgi:hypothetical protein
MNVTVPFSSLSPSSPMDYEKQLSKGSASRNPFKRLLGCKMYCLKAFPHFYLNTTLQKKVRAIQ